MRASQLTELIKLKQRFSYLLLFAFLPFFVVAQNQLKLNQIQVIGSHNSYKTGLDIHIAKQLDQIEPGFADKISYAHPSLPTQLDLGLRQLEIDILMDEQGALFAKPLAQKWTSNQLHTKAQQRALNQPGFKVLHIPDIDVQTHCISFKSCLSQLKNWSNQNPNHLPVYILFNVKESRFNKINGVIPAVLNSQNYQALDQLIYTELGSEKLMTPALIKQPNLTLSQSIRQFGWPELEQVRGKFAFIFDANKNQLAQFSASQTHAIFAAFELNHPDAAFLIYNHPLLQAEQIKQAVEQGFIVRTRADEFNHNESPKMRALTAINSGAQIISTDFYKGAMQTPLNAPFVSFELVTSQPKNLFARCIHLAPNTKCSF
ncbi:phosphatidylinositol-specific phospholipase C1-like protein [Catenovulum sp. 2E275]|uniref:phosphatidylinositol-specific phospholipase C1-like protein n=1 Tax=Catenovulum sp. 2E275 TaxID=2980497 RepID=UPI0021D28E99|nr:phosphatidylinositol-specific phospholipase C1-like protein [Catenovulum sp. 2E275]MCU4676677.1 phosphatidylinositol-specific phospholipase C1-like protein [Catenovulum sp. 2E275]